MTERNRRLRRRVFSCWLGAFVLAVAGRLLAHGGEDHGEAGTAQSAVAQPASGQSGVGIGVTKEQQFALGMLTEIAGTRSIVERVEVTGSVIPRTDAVADVVAPIAGKVIGSRLPQRGERVSRGQVLFRVAQVLAPSERAALRTEQIRARTELSTADREVQRLERLEGVVAGKQIIEARIRRDAARETYNALTGQLSGAGESVAVTAPISGEITMAEIASGEVLDGSRVVYRISDLSRVWIEANLFEQDVARVQGATSAEISLPSAPDRTFQATLYKLAGAVDPETRTIAALFSVDNPNQILKLGMSAKVQVASGESVRALAAPSAAVVKSGARTVVFVHTTPERFEARDIQLGDASSGGYVQVRSGLIPGDRVVVTGTHQLRALAGL